MKGVLRMPEVLRISPGVLEAKVAYYTGGMQTPQPVNLLDCLASQCSRLLEHQHGLPHSAVHCCRRNSCCEPTTAACHPVAQCPLPSARDSIACLPTLPHALCLYCLGAEELGLTKCEVGAMYARDPGTLLTSLAHIQEVSAWLR